MAETPAPPLQYIDLSRTVARFEFSPREQLALDLINQQIAGAVSLDAAMTFLFETTRSICPCDRIGLAFVEEQGQRVIAHWCQATYEPIYLKKGYAEDLQGSSLERILTTSQLRIINDLEAYYRDHPHSRSTPLLLKEGVRSSMTCPLVVDDRIVGLLFRSSRHPYSYSEHQWHLHRAVAQRLSQTVEKAYRIEQLDQANRSYTEMLGFVSHELKSPLASMVMDMQLLTEGYIGELAPKQHEKIEKSIGKAHYLLGLIREYLDLARIEQGELTMNAETEVDFLTDVVEASFDVAQAQMLRKAMQVTLSWTVSRNGSPVKRFHKLLTDQPDSSAPQPLTDEPIPTDTNQPDQPPAPDQPDQATSTELTDPVELTAEDRVAQCDSDLLKIVMVNLLSNAAKYGYQGGRIDVTIVQAEDHITVAVRNEGPGFESSHRSKLFRKFSRLDKPELKKEKGTGVGLYTSWRIIHLHGGRITADSEPGQWAQFTFTLPQPIPDQEATSPS